MLLERNIRPVWAEINLDYLKHNVKEIRKIVKKDTMICAMLKADGYKHGAIQIAKTLLENGVDRIAVAILSEAIELRRAGYTIPLMVIGYTPEDCADIVIDNDVIQTIYTYDQALAFSKIAVEKNKDLTIHLKIETGMSRLGFLPNKESLDDIEKIFQLPNLIIEGIFTHFATADHKDKTYVYRQFNLFTEFINKLEKKGYKIPVKHTSNSAAIIDLPEMNMDMVRPGIILYGIYPSDEVKKEKLDLKQVMELKARVSHVKTLPKGQSVGYGSKYITKEEEQIITIPIGYADGYTRMLSGKAEIIAKGKRIPIIGNICMDQCMANATGLDINTGDEVTLYSSQKKSGITIDDIANKIGTINYEVICMLDKRVPKVYMENNNILHIVDTLII